MSPFSYIWPGERKLSPFCLRLKGRFAQGVIRACEAIG